MKFNIKTKNVDRTYDVENHFKAIKEFFLEIAQSKIEIKDIGLLATCESDGMDMVPFRTLPALFALKIIRWEEYKANSMEIAKFSRRELMDQSEKDRWMGDYIQTVLDGSDPDE